MKEIVQDLKDGKSKAAIFKMDEVLGYQINDEISGRIKNARMKMEEGLMDASISMMERVVRLLEKNMNSTGKNSAMPISIGEINARLLYILDDLSNFKLRDSINKVTDLQKYELPDYVAEDLVIIKGKLEEYDDEEAEKLVRALLEKMKQPGNINRKKEDSTKADPENGQGYHYNRLL